MLQSAAYIPPLTFAFTTLILIWAFGGGDPMQFWLRSPALALSMILLAAVTPAFSIPTIKAFRESRFWQSPKLRGALVAGFVFALPMVISAIVLRSSAETNPSWIAKYLSEIPGPTFFSILLLTFVVSPIWELYWRGILAPGWGLKTTAFLEALVWGFAGQHVVFFLSVLLMALVGGILSRRWGLFSAAACRAIWTFLILISLALTGT